MNGILEKLKEILTAVMYAAEASEYETVLERIAHVARELIKTKYAAIGIPNGEGGLRFFKTSGLTPEEEAKIPHLPRGRGLIGAIMRERKVIRMNDMSENPDVYGFPEHHPKMTTFLGAPIIVANHLYGMLYLSDKIDGTVFSDDDEILLETLAGYAALAIAGAQLSENESRLRLLEERERIGMELHDGVIQSLYGIGMQVDLMRRSGEEIRDTHLNTLVNDLNDVIEDIRAFIGNLRSRRQQVSISECLARLRDRLHPPDDIVISIDAPESAPPFSASAFESICLIANEAMSNAIRHADAKEIQLKVHQTKSHFVIVVEDDGTGFDPQVMKNGSGLGLRNMHQRARLFGGHVNIESANGKGTRLEVAIPLGTY